jgi:hypothetical protein
MVVAKRFKKLEQAEKFLNQLYESYDNVKLVRAPVFGEEGVYVYSVEDKVVKK